VRRWWPAIASLALVACADLIGSSSRSISLSIVPVFNVADPYAVAAATADSLRIVVIRKDSTGAFQDTVVRAEVAIDPDSGTANTTLSVPLLTSPQAFVIVLSAVRSADGTVLFSGLDTVQVTSESGSTPATVPVSYVGPRAARLTIAPKDTALTSGSFAFRVTAFDSSNAQVPGVYVTFAFVNKADSSKLTLGKYTGAAASVAGASGVVSVYALAPGGVSSDTASVFLGSVPLGVKVTPGFANVVPGSTVTLTGQVVDAGGNPVAGSVTWQSRSPGIATVTNGTVMGVTPGTAVVVATGSGFSDSALITVAPLTNVIVTAMAAGRGFGDARVGDTVVVDLSADLRYTPSELLGSYQASLDWNAAVLQFIDVQPTAFAAPVVNAGTGTCAHQLCLAGADPQNATANVIVARARFRALTAGSGSPVLGITELSSNVPPTYTNLYAASRVTVTSGSVTVRP
jgi:hypothetical protein